MIIRNEQQALCIAVEMERRAVRVYERALMITSDPAVCRGIQDILKDEQEHLRRFTAMKADYPAGEEEEKLLLQALASEMLFPGGVMELERAEGLATLKGLYTYACESEQTAVERYLAFAAKCASPAVNQCFRAIAKEEATHLAELKKVVAELQEEADA